MLLLKIILKILQGPTPPPSHDSTPYHNSAAVQTQFPAGPTPFPHVQTSASTIAYSAYQPYNKQPSMYNNANSDDISKDKAYNYDYIIGQGVDKVESKGAAAPNNVLPFMNNIAEVIILVALLLCNCIFLVPRSLFISLQAHC